MTTLLAQELSKSVKLPSGKPLVLLRSVSLTVEGGQSVAVVGRSGSGKSTLLALLGLLAAADSGRLQIGGQEVSRLNDRDRSRLRNEHIGFVFQNYSLLGHLNAAENVALPFSQGKPIRGTEVRRRVHSVMESVGIAHLAASKPRQLSGGEQQRVAIARALVRSPGLVLADEPTGALDTATADQVLTTLVDTVKEQGAALVMVTHDRVVAERADRLVRLEEASLCA